MIRVRPRIIMPVLFGFTVLAIFELLLYLRNLKVTPYVMNVTRHSDPNANYRTIFVTRGLNPVNIAIVTVLQDRSNFSEYKTALNLVECYAIYHKYNFFLIDISLNKTLQQLCPHKDIMFRRHCVVAETLSNTNSAWILFIDADTTVINPNHLIEEYIDEDYNIIFYQRTFTLEIVAGGYLAKNSEYTKKFLRGWADYESKLPNSHNNRDNGALHSHLFNVLYPEKEKEREECERYWRISKSPHDIAYYFACIQYFLGQDKKWPNQLKILGKGAAWSRDTWLTQSKWCNKDFLLHRWKKRTLNAGNVFGSYPSPLTSLDIDLSLCNGSDAALNWPYKAGFIKSNKEIKNWLNQFIGPQNQNYRSRVRQILKRFDPETNYVLNDSIHL